MAPGEIVALFGSAIGPPDPTSLALTNPVLVANALEGVHVLFDGAPAPVLFASAGQVNVVVPYAVAGESSTVVQVEYLGALSPPVSLPVAPTAPGIFTLNASGAGPGAILNAADDSVNSSLNPVAHGDWVSVFATGGGATTPAGVDGLLPGGPSYSPNASVSVNIGGLDCPLNYEGAAPGLVSGLLQINAQVPAGVGSGNVPVVLLSTGQEACRTTANDLAVAEIWRRCTHTPRAFSMRCDGACEELKVPMTKHGIYQFHQQSFQ